MTKSAFATSAALSVAVAALAPLAGVPPRPLYLRPPDARPQAHMAVARR